VKPLAVSLGDPAGVGPELICQAWLQRESEGLTPFAVTGGWVVMTGAAADCPVRQVESIDEARDVFGHALPILAGGDCRYHPGSPDRESAQTALASLQQATMLAIGGEAAGVVTAPIAKSRLAEVGFGFPGQTEFLADACKTRVEDAVMMLAGPSLRTVPLTIHIPLADVPANVSKELIVHRARIVARALEEDFGIPRPRLAIAALNPHAGEAGRMGREEIEIIAPAIEQLRAEGIDATGPHPADTLFAPRARATYDVAIAMYHDQALIPLKVLDFDQGVNVTLGLPIVRTSPDHGTAFGIAGKGIADPGAMIAAIRMAGEIAARRARA
jgi:4-hydroxythreonine-4-phosphate dehydrogenase